MYSPHHCELPNLYIPKVSLQFQNGFIDFHNFFIKEKFRTGSEMDVSFGILAYVPNEKPIRSEPALLETSEKQKNLIAVTDTPL